TEIEPGIVEQTDQFGHSERLGATPPWLQEGLKGLASQRDAAVTASNNIGDTNKVLSLMDQAYAGLQGNAKLWFMTNAEWLKSRFTDIPPGQIDAAANDP